MDKCELCKTCKRAIWGHDDRPNITPWVEDCAVDLEPRYNRTEEVYECDSYNEIDEFDSDMDYYGGYNPYMD